MCRYLYQLKRIPTLYIILRVSELETHLVITLIEYNFLSIYAMKYRMTTHNIIFKMHNICSLSILICVRHVLGV